MSQARTIYSLVLRPETRAKPTDAEPEGRVLVSARTVRFRKLGFGEIMTALKLAGNDSNPTVRVYSQQQEAMRRAITEVDGNPVTYDELAGNAGWDSHFTSEETFLILSAFSQVHEPQGRSLGNSLTVVAGA